MSDPYPAADRPDDAAARPVPALPEPPVTGDAVVDGAVVRLLDVAAIPVDEQPAVYDEVHRALQDRLADVEG